MKVGAGRDKAHRARCLQYPRIHRPRVFETGRLISHRIDRIRIFAGTDRLSFLYQAWGGVGAVGLRRVHFHLTIKNTDLGDPLVTDGNPKRSAEVDHMGGCGVDHEADR